MRQKQKNQDSNSSFVYPISVTLSLSIPLPWPAAKRPGLEDQFSVWIFMCPPHVGMNIGPLFEHPAYEIGKMYYRRLVSDYRGLIKLFQVTLTSSLPLNTSEISSLN